MAKSKGKATVAASVGPLKVEAASGNDAIAESAPSQSFQVETEAATEVPDMSKEADTIKEAKDAREQSEEGDKKEETADVLDQSEEGDDDEGTAEDVDEAEEENGDEDGEDDEEDDDENEEQAKENGKEEPAVAADVVPEGEKVEEGEKKGEGKESGKAENAPNKKARRMRKKKRAASGGASKPGEADKAGSSGTEKKDPKKTDGMGLIFMCNAKTKKDCFQYKVFGLPESKKDLVAKVYKGMRLFLFDVDLKLMYGIYRATSPGGYNIEPKAFKSAYPSQVRFNILDDCSPLPEEKFKPAIKENYYGRHKFNCQLSLEQVKSLCKIFKSGGKLAKTKEAPRDVTKVEPKWPSTGRTPKRPRRDEPAPSAQDRKRPRRDGPAPAARDQKRPLRERERWAPPVRAPRREAYDPRPLELPPPLPPVYYSYDRPAVDDYYYRRDPRPLEVAPRPLEPPEYPYGGGLYREPVAYREPVYAPPPQSVPSATYGPPPLYYRY